jgi:hypothetical protein
VNASTVGGTDVGNERLIQMRNGLYSEFSPVHRTTKLRAPLATPGFVGDIAKEGKTDTLEGEKVVAIEGTTIQEQVDSGQFSKLKGLHSNLYTEDSQYAPKGLGGAGFVSTRNLGNILVPQEKVEEGNDKVANLFFPKRWPSANGGSEQQALTWVARDQTFIPKGVRSSPDVTPDNLAVRINGEDETTGLVKAAEQGRADKNYMPFSFQDLRDTGNAGAPFLYFRAFLKPGMSETFTPDWQAERYYGRVDQVPIYMGTMRAINLAFDVVAWGPEDLPVMWRKLEKLQSMVYPFYNKGGFYKSGPIIRMRVGDLFAAENKRGLPGYITSMDWSYEDGIWNLKEDFKVPRFVTVSLGFTVLHDGNPGTYPFAESEEGSQISFGEDVNEQPQSTEGFTFGAGKVISDSGNTKIKVSSAEIRRIFATVKNK